MNVATHTHTHTLARNKEKLCSVLRHVPLDTFLHRFFFPFFAVFFFMFPPFLLVLGYFEFNGKFIDDMPLSRLTWTFAFAFEAEPPAHNFAISWPQNSSTPILAAPSCVQSFRIRFALVGIHELAHALHSG